MKVTLLIPTVNEVEGMKIIMPRVKREWVDQILFVDGGSNDGTVEYAREHGYTVIQQQRKGLRHAFTEALPHITGDVVITFTPDGNSIPERIPSLIEKMKEGYDMVIVSRYLDGARSYDDDLITGFGNWLYTRIINFLFRAQYTDTMVMYRAYRTRLMRELELDRDATYRIPETILHTVEGWELILSVRAARRKLKVGEIPGDEPKRIGGERKLQVFRWGLAHLFHMFWDFFFWR